MPKRGLTTAGAEPPTAGAAARSRRRLPGNPASAVYGTILVAGQLVVDSTLEIGAAKMVATLAATLAVFWLVHAYTDTLGGAITSATTPSLTRALREEWPIVESGFLPAVTIGLATWADASSSTAALAALILAVVELLGWAFLAARRADLGPARTVRYTVVATALGVLMIGLKYLIH